MLIGTETPSPTVIEQQQEFLRQAAEKREQEARDRELALRLATVPNPTPTPTPTPTPLLVFPTQPHPLPTPPIVADRDTLLREQATAKARMQELQRWYEELVMLPNSEHVRLQLFQVREQLTALQADERQRVEALGRLAIQDEEQRRIELQLQAARDEEYARRVARDAELLVTDAEYARLVARQQRDQRVRGFELAHCREPSKFWLRNKSLRDYRRGLFDVKRSGEEWEWVVQALRIPMYRVTRIRRNQNPELWERVARERDQIVHDNLYDFGQSFDMENYKRRANQQLVFARISNAETNTTLCDTGFDLDTHGSHGRQGVCQSTTSTTSVSFVRSDTDLCWWWW
jgi:hypothetical protein